MPVENDFNNLNFDQAQENIDNIVNPVPAVDFAADPVPQHVEEAVLQPAELPSIRSKETKVSQGKLLRQRIFSIFILLHIIFNFSFITV